MSREALFIETLKQQYEREGWKALVDEEVNTEIGFAADLVLQKGEEHLVIDVKEAGYSESRALKVIKKLIETRRGWRFEVKVIPPSWNPDSSEGMPDEIQKRIDLSRYLASNGHVKEAFILVWTSLESLLRTRVQADQNKLLPITDLIRQSYENGIIGALQLHSFHRVLSLRNKLMHGMSADVSGDDVETMFKLITSVSSLPQASRHTQAP